MAASKSSTKSKKAKEEELEDEDLDTDLEDSENGDMDFGAEDLEEDGNEERRPRREEEDEDDDEDLRGTGTPSGDSLFGEEKLAEAKPEHLGLRNFRGHPDFENFYRFVNEYGLRREAYITLDKVLNAISPKRKKSTRTRGRSKK